MARRLLLRSVCMQTQVVSLVNCVQISTSVECSYHWDEFLWRKKISKLVTFIFKLNLRWDYLIRFKYFIALILLQKNTPQASPKLPNYKWIHCFQILQIKIFHCEKLYEWYHAMDSMVIFTRVYMVTCLYICSTGMPPLLWGINTK